MESHHILMTDRQFMFPKTFLLLLWLNVKHFWLFFRQKLEIDLKNEPVPGRKWRFMEALFNILNCPYKDTDLEPSCFYCLEKNTFQKVQICFIDKISFMEAGAFVACVLNGQWWSMLKICVTITMNIRIVERAWIGSTILFIKMQQPSSQGSKSSINQQLH